MIMNTCEKFQFELASLDQGESTPHKVRQHLATCPHCRAFASSLANQNQLMDDLIYPQIPNWPELIDQAFLKTPVAVHKFGIASPSSSRRERLFGKIALTVALSASLMVAVGGWLVGPYLGTFAHKSGRERVVSAPEPKQPAPEAKIPDPTPDPSNELPTEDHGTKTKAESPPDPKVPPSSKPTANTKTFGSPTGANGRMNSGSLASSPMVPSGSGSETKSEQNKNSDGKPGNVDQEKNKEAGSGFAINPAKNLPVKILVDLDFEKKLKLANKPGLQVQFVQNLFQDQYNSVLAQISTENLTRSKSGNQLTDSTGSLNNPDKELNAFERGNSQKGNSEGRKNPASKTTLGRNLQHGESPWDRLIQGQQDLLDHTILPLKKLLPSASNAKDLEPLVKDLRKQKEDYLRNASLYPQHADALKKLADLAQTGLGILGDSREGKAR